MSDRRCQNVGCYRQATVPFKMGDGRISRRCPSCAVKRSGSALSKPKGVAK